VTTDLRHATGVAADVASGRRDGRAQRHAGLVQRRWARDRPDGSPTAPSSLGLALTAAGADCVDVGGESTRPGAAPVAVDEELARVVPVVAGLAARGRRRVGRHAPHRGRTRGARAGASIVNDVGALAPDDGMLAAVAAPAPATSSCTCVASRAPCRTTRASPTSSPRSRPSWRVHVDAAVAAGRRPDAIALDPGIGFGKTLEHNLALLAAVPRLARTEGVPLLVGTSRKSFLGRLTGVSTPAERLAGSLASAVLAARDGARILRVHDVAATVEALAVQAAVDAPHGGRRRRMMDRIELRGIEAFGHHGVLPHEQELGQTFTRRRRARARPLARRRERRPRRHGRLRRAVGRPRMRS
jgi:dihydropteroate synthase